MRSIVAAISLACVLGIGMGSEAEAKSRHGVHRHPVANVRSHHVRHVRHHRRGRVRHARREGLEGGRGIVTIKTLSGLPVRVAGSVASTFSGFLREFESSGYRIRFIGGYSVRKIAGTNRWSKHASGLAIDVCQTARNRVACQLPPNVTAMAARHGLVHGAVWRHPDAGHFEIGGSTRYARRGHRV